MWPCALPVPAWSPPGPRPPLRQSTQRAALLAAAQPALAAFATLVAFASLTQVLVACAMGADLAAYDQCPCASGWECCYGRCVPEGEHCSASGGDSSGSPGDESSGDGLAGDVLAGDAAGGDALGGDSQSDSGPACDADSDCPTALCRAGRCASCDAATDCQSGYCRAGACTACSACPGDDCPQSLLDSRCRPPALCHAASGSCLPPCASDDDCTDVYPDPAGGTDASYLPQRCWQGRCLGGDACSDATDCRAAEVCDGASDAGTDSVPGRCAPPPDACTDSLQCPLGWECDATGTCRDPLDLFGACDPLASQPCLGVAGCGDGGSDCLCLLGWCDLPPPACRPDADSDCPADQYCDASFNCRGGPACDADSDCAPDGLICNLASDRCDNAPPCRAPDGLSPCSTADAASEACTCDLFERCWYLSRPPVCLPE